MNKPFCIGIDALNLNYGGGHNYLVEILQGFDYIKGNFRIIVWGKKHTLSKIKDYDWIIKREVSGTRLDLIYRTFWQFFLLRGELKSFKCDVLFCPGSVNISSFSPSVSLNQNHLPFDFAEISRYGFSARLVKLIILFFVNSFSYKKSDGVIFLSEFSRKSISHRLNLSNTITIPHGLSPSFKGSRKTSCNLAFADRNTIKLIYVSAIDVYKNHSKVIEGVFEARNRTGVNFHLEIIGPVVNKKAFRCLQKAIKRFDSSNDWIKLKGAVEHNEIGRFYDNAQIGIWASSCEAFGMIQVEMMSRELIVIASEMGPSHEILGEAAFYYNPYDPVELCTQLIEVLSLSDLEKYKRVQMGRSRMELYDWEKTAISTLDYLYKCAKK
jgi:glycosyltransferase involved in cell wall biosynthesis